MSVPSEGRGIVAGVAQRLRHPGTRLITATLLLAAGMLLLILVYWIMLLAQLPSGAEIKRARSERATEVYTADGVELTTYGEKNQKWVSLGEISQYVMEALIATEDHRFFKHWGIDAQRAAGSLLQTLEGDWQGGSTITMQLARNAFPNLYDDTPITRKIKEWVIAVRIETMFEKDEILEMYLNTVPFMYNAFGIEAAARTYFQKSAAELDVLESATLIGMLKGTVYYNPVRNPERAHERRNVVLQQMAKHGYLEQASYEEVEDTPTRLNFERISRTEGLAPHFSERLRQWLEAWAEQHGYSLETGGLHVYTTIDSRLQRAAQEAVERVTEELQAVADVEWSQATPAYFSADARSYKNYRRSIDPFAYFWTTHQDLLDSFIEQTPRFERMLERGVSEAAARESLRSNAAFLDSLKEARQRLEAGLVAIDPRSGHVMAWVGGRDFEKGQYDHVAVAKRQPGSTFKPFVYAAALENGYAPDDRLRDEVVQYVDPQTNRVWSPENVGSATGELVTLRDALAHSKNTITAQLVIDVGPERVVDYAHRMGVESELDPFPSIGLGTSEVSLLELTAAYGVLADGGRYHEPLFVRRIEDQNGQVLASFSSEERQVLAAETAHAVLDMLRGVIDYGTGVRIRNQFGLDGDLAGKTGTSQGGADGWFLLMHPHLVVGSWVGFDAAAITFRSDYWGQGSHTALGIVGDFYKRAKSRVPAVLDDTSFEPPPG